MSDDMVGRAKRMARRAYDATIGHPLASGKGRHKYAAQQGFDGSKQALRDGAYSPVSMSRDVVKAAASPQHNVRNTRLRRRGAQPATEY